MKKIYLGAISALLLASCTTIQKASKTAKGVNEIGETIYNFKPQKTNQKKTKKDTIQDVSKNKLNEFNL